MAESSFMSHWRFTQPTHTSFTATFPGLSTHIVVRSVATHSKICRCVLFTVVEWMDGPVQQCHSDNDFSVDITLLDSCFLML